MSPSVPESVAGPHERGVGKDARRATCWASHLQSLRRVQRW